MSTPNLSWPLTHAQTWLPFTSASTSTTTPGIHTASARVRAPGGSTTTPPLEGAYFA
eukprot:CAMPEP_0119471104 /NCGR_PEP_ID=MMETSP1344-20130328/3712_1 /TAXON_ID=236787 /ORGANISM="Florenciella parvula, Strain CCMP2471" /LENGTH=56 /DNA_ID=CAMNT_0007503845 /DNA_START=31 /DNA_END=201 /DNA_ORIENTATION=-